MLMNCDKCSKEYVRQRNRRNKDGLLLCSPCSITERNKNWQKSEKGKASRRAFHARNGYAHQKAYSKTEAYLIMRSNAPSLTKEGRNRYHKQRIATDSMYRLKCNLRSRFRMAFKNNSKTGSAIRDLGCTIKQFKEHLESLFDDKMTWDNYGSRGWHVDHVVPLCRFDLSDYEQLKKACHYTNLQPLWAFENVRKQS